MNTGADWLPKIWWDFFSRGPQKKKMLPPKRKCCQKKFLPKKKKKKRSLNKNYERVIAAAQTGNSHELR
jgi:hypothetical protein